MCRQCFNRSLGCYTPATDDMIPRYRDDVREFWQGYEDWLDEKEEEYNEMCREERDYE